MKIDTTTNQIVGTAQSPAGAQPYHVAFDGTHMWVTSRDGRIDKILAHF